MMHFKKTSRFLLVQSRCKLSLAIVIALGSLIPYCNTFPFPDTRRRCANEKAPMAPRPRTRKHLHCPLARPTVNTLFTDT